MLRLRALMVVPILGCVPHLVPHEVTTLSCTKDIDCPKPSACAPLKQRCFATLDTTPPELVSVISTGTLGVVLVLSERADATYAQTPDRFSIVDQASGAALATEAVAFDSNDTGGRTLRLTTAHQAPHALYTLSTTLEDEQGNTAAVSATFFGYGAAPDTTAPTVFAPQDNTIALVGATGGVIALVWAARAGASLYTVDVATDSAFTAPVAGSPFSTTDTTLSFAPTEPREHFWRVRADVTAPATFASARFSVLFDALHVYCAASADCSAGVAVERGDWSYPFRSVARAAKQALAQGVPKIKIAARGGTPGQAYGEQLTFGVGGVTLLGGYDQTFAETARDPSAHPTRLAHTDNVITVLGISTPLVFDGLSIETLAGTGVSPIVTALFATGPAARVELDDCNVSIDEGLALAVGISATLANSGEIKLAKGTDIRVNGLINGFGVEDVGGTLTLDDTRVVVSVVGRPSALTISPGTTARVTNTLLYAESTGGSHVQAVDIEGGSVFLAHDTLVARGMYSCEGVTLSSLEGPAILLNNAIVLDCMTPDPCVVEETGGDPASIQDNAFVGCDPLYDDQGTLLTAASGPTAINMLDGEAFPPGPSGDTSRYDGNVASAVTPSGFFVGPLGATGDFHLSTAALAATPHGKPTTGNDCGSHSQPVSCGNITADHDGRARSATGPTIGAFEGAP